MDYANYAKSARARRKESKFRVFSFLFLLVLLLFLLQLLVLLWNDFLYEFWSSKDKIATVQKYFDVHKIKADSPKTKQT